MTCKSTFSVRIFDAARDLVCGFSDDVEIRLCVCYSNSARFLWKSIPLAMKDSQPELSAVWQIAQRLWIKEYSGVYEALRSFSWSPEVEAIVAAFSGDCLTVIH